MKPGPADDAVRSELVAVGVAALADANIGAGELSLEEAGGWNWVCHCWSPARKAGERVARTPEPADALVAVAASNSATDMPENLLGSSSIANSDQWQRCHK